MRAVDEVRELLGAMDPARGGPPPDVERRERDLHRILGSAGPTGRPRPRRRLVLVGGAAVAAVAVMAGIAVAVVGKPDLAYAATPPLLSYLPPPTTEQASTRLRQLAEVAAAAPALPRPVGTVEHLRSINWYLNSAASGGHVVSAVIPQERQSWRTDDNAGRQAIRTLAPAFISDRSRTTWVVDGAEGREEVTEYPAGKFREGWEGAVPTNEAALRQWLVPGGLQHASPVLYLQDIAQLALVRLLGPAQRAAVLRLLANLPGITVTGTVVDRAGRGGEAFSIVTDFHGLPIQYAIIIDPSNGSILGYEEVLIKTAGRLNVRIPAVISCSTYLVSEYTQMPQ